MEDVLEYSIMDIPEIKYSEDIENLNSLEKLFLYNSNALSGENKLAYLLEYLYLYHDEELYSIKSEDALCRVLLRMEKEAKLKAKNTLESIASKITFTEDCQYSFNRIKESFHKEELDELFDKRNKIRDIKFPTETDKKRLNELLERTDRIREEREEYIKELKEKEYMKQLSNILFPATIVEICRSEGISVEEAIKEMDEEHKLKEFKCKKCNAIVPMFRKRCKNCNHIIVNWALFGCEKREEEKRKKEKNKINDIIQQKKASIIQKDILN